ncbi:MAG: hypothetical protein JXR94_04920, partial [Candidatus Hydrogenedentes bacterium]|nr:hypothetical protein [Candidatus Hydrogenedentota bacterium]
MWYAILAGMMAVAADDEAQPMPGGPVLVEGAFELANVLPPLMDDDDPRAPYRRAEGELPIIVPPFEQHVRRFSPVPPKDAVFERARQLDAWAAWRRTAPDIPVGRVTGFVQDGPRTWIGTECGLFLGTERHPHYGVDGPLATRITALALDSKGALWVGTPLGLSVREADGAWRALRGGDGLPFEYVTALAVDGRDRLWIGTTRGAVHYRPYESGRQWFYRAGERYLPGDAIDDIALSEDGAEAYFATDKGLGCIATVTTTLLEKAVEIEKRLNARHRRLGLVAECFLDDAENPTSHRIPDKDNDGLWTAYHVAAMSLCYAVTG